MADNENSNNDNEDPKDLRTKLEAALEREKQLISENTTFKQEQQFRDAGLGHLSQRQRRILAREINEEGGEFNAETAMEVAKELGFPEKKVEQQQDGQGQQQQGQQQEQSQGDPQVDGRVNEALNGFQVAQTAQAAALRGQTDPSVETAIREAKTPEELRSIIRKRGAGVGIVHSFDVE